MRFPFKVALLLITSILSQFPIIALGWSCQGETYKEAIENNCIDKGAQRVSSGGMVTVIIEKATNLPDLDQNTGLSSGVSDPRVVIKYGQDHVLA